MFPELAICAPATVTYILAPIAPENGVHLLFACHELLFMFDSAATRNTVIVNLLAEVPEDIRQENAKSLG